MNCSFSHTQTKEATSNGRPEWVSRGLKALRGILKGSALKRGGGTESLPKPLVTAPPWAYGS